MEQEYKLVGKIKEAHGLKGDFYVLVFSGDVSWSKELSSVQLKNPQTGEVHTFKPKKSKPFKKGMIFSVEGITDRTAAEKFHGFHFLIPSDSLISKPGETIYLSEIEGFEIRDPEGKVLGHIVGFSSNGPQDLLIVEGENSRGEIPFVKEFIQEINFEQKFISMDLPEGLFDLDRM